TTGGRAVERAGVQVALPAPTELLWHGLTHALRHRADAFRLRFLLDGAAILATPAAFDWGEIERRLGTAEIGRRPAAAAWPATAQPWLNSTSWSESRSIRSRSCDTNTIVTPAALKPRIRSRQRSRNRWSPTANASSIRKTSGSACTATANPSRSAIPDE